MKVSRVFLLLSLCLSGWIMAGDAEEAAVREAVLNAYVNGTQLGNTEAMAKGFHQEFEMFIPSKEDSVRKMTRDEWIKRIEDGKKKNPDRVRPKVHADFPMVKVTGNAAIIQVELYFNDVHAFTDFISLYKFSDGWKIVAKTYHRHPR